MKLIIDSGSTKMHLCLLTPDGICREWELPGVNALTASEETLRALFAAQDFPELQSVHFYGAGVATPAIAEKVKRALPAAPVVEVCSDLLGAARALLGHEKGVAVILGTGANSGLYDGQQIVRNIPPLGYILGDEGSGANIGIRFLRALYRDELEPSLRPLFEQETGLTYADVLNAVYRPEPDAPRPNAFLASLVPFIRRHSSDFPRLQALIKQIFTDFFRAIVCQYAAAEVAFTGGVAAAFAPELRAACPEGVSIIKIDARPMAGLIKFHES